MLCNELKIGTAKRIWQREARAEGGEDVFALWEQGLTLEEAKKKFFSKDNALVPRA